MDVTTGREFSETNPQDDPHLYPRLPAGLSYDFNGNVRAMPRLSQPPQQIHPIAPQHNQQSREIAIKYKNHN